MSGQNPVAKRLQADLMQLMMDPVTGITALPDDEDLQSWHATITGSDDGMYAGMEFSLAMKFSSNYPMTAPTVKFETPIFHPNIDMSGNICLDILKDKWSAAYTVTTLLLSLQALLDTPNNSSPLNNQAAMLWDNREEFLRFAKRRYNNLPIA